MRTRCPDRWPLAAIEHAKLDCRTVCRPPHDTAQGINLANYRTLGDTANGGIAGHLSNRLKGTRHECNAAAKAGRGNGRLGAGVTAADHEDIK